MRVAVYARVSTGEQNPTNQLEELRRYCGARGWTIHREYIDHGVSGAKESRPALDDMLRDAKRRTVDGVVVWRLDRLGRNLRHLILTLDALTSVGVAFVSLGEGIDTATAAGRLQLHILGAIAEFERGRIAERVRLGLARARRQGQRLGRPRRTLQRAQALLAEMRQRPHFAGNEQIVLGFYRRMVHNYPEMPAEVALQVAYRKMLRRRKATATP